MGAQYSGYIEFKAKGAPLAFVFPATGVPAVPETYGIVADGPHPNAAELFMDWFLSPVGQQALGEALLLHSPRADVPAPAGGVRAQGHEAADPGRLERLREGPAGVRQGVGPHRRRAALRADLAVACPEASCGRASTGRR